MTGGIRLLIGVVLFHTIQYTGAGFPIGMGSIGGSQLMGGGGFGGGGMRGGIGYGGGGMRGGIGYGGVGMGGVGLGLGGGGMGSGGGMSSGGGGMGFGGGIGLGGGMGFGGLKSSGGSEMMGSSFGGENKNVNDLFFQKGFGNQGGQFNQGQSGFAKGEGLIKDIKGNSGSYSGANGGKNIFEDGKMFNGQQHFGKEGTNLGQENAKKGHKKGHTVKGFKTAHQSDESSNTEEVYDEAHDEADKKAFAGEEGGFGENNQGMYKGEKEDVKFSSGQAKKEGKFANEFLADKENAEQAKYGQNKHVGDGTSYAVNNGGNLHNNAGHQEFNKFHKHYPKYL